MKILISAINVGFAEFNLVFRTKYISRYFLSRNLTYSSMPLLDDEQVVLEDSTNAVGWSLPCAKCCSTEYVTQDKFSNGPNIYEEILSTNHEAEEHAKTIKLILESRGWNLASGSGYKVELDEFNIVRILDDLFVESLDAGLAFYFFRWSEHCTGSKHTIRSVCKMIHILVSGNLNHRGVDLILHLVRSDSVKEGLHNLLLKILYDTHTRREVLKTVYSMLVQCFVKENMVSVALEITYKLKQLNMFPTVRVCNSLLKGLLVSQKSDLAWDFFEEMQSQGMRLNVSIISLFIAALCSQGNLTSAWKLLSQMKNYGVKPDVVAYTIVVDSLCKICCLKEATSVLFKMIELGIPLDSVLISSVIDGYCKFRKSEVAIDVMKYFNLAPNVFVYNSFMSELCTDGRVVEASFILHEMYELGLLPDCVSYTTIIGGYCKVRDIYKAFQYLGKMLKSGTKPSIVTYTLLIDTYCKSGDMEMAECLFQKMVSEGLLPDIITYNTLMDGYGKKGHLHKAFELLSRMRSAAVSPDIVTYNMLMHGLVRRGFVSEAKDILDELLRRGFPPDVVTFTNVLDGFSKRGIFEDAFLVWSCMSEHRVEPDVVTCSALLNGYCRTHRMEEANMLFLKMLDAGLNPDLILFNTLIHGFCSVGNIDDACSLVSMMVKEGICPNIVTHRALVLGFEKKWAKDPEERASSKLQEIMLKHGIDVDVGEYIAMVQ